MSGSGTRACDLLWMTGAMRDACRRNDVWSMMKDTEKELVKELKTSDASTIR